MQTAQKKSFDRRKSAREQTAQHEPVQEDYSHVECGVEHGVGVSRIFELQREFWNKLVHEQ